MGGRSARARVRMLISAAVAALLVLVAAAPAAARPSSGPAVDIQPFAGVTPDGERLTLQVLASCPERWTVVEASVAVSQPTGSGRASFPLTCIGSLRMFAVTVPSTAGTFAPGPAQFTATVVVKRGKTDRAQDTEVVDVQPTVLVELADSARIEGGGEAVTIDVTVACFPGSTGLESRLVVSQSGQTIGVGTYVPICDGTRHTFTVHVVASQGVYRPGIAQALTFANTEFDGNVVYGIDDDGALELIG